MTNEEIDVRSHKKYDQKVLFFYKVSIDFEQTVRIANRGARYSKCAYPRTTERSLPLLNCSTWDCFSVFEFNSKRDAQEAARSIHSLSRRPTILKDVEAEIRLVNALRAGDQRDEYILWNGVDKVRVIPGFDVSFLEKRIAARSKTLRYKYHENTDV